MARILIANAVDPVAMPPLREMLQKVMAFAERVAAADKVVST